MDKVKKHFDEVSKDYDLYKKKNKFYYDNLKSLLSSLIPKNKIVLEFGCGTGDILVSINPKKGIGYDLSPEMIRIAKQKHKNKKNLIFTHNSLSTAHYSPDVVFMTDVIEHLEDPQAVFNKISKLLTKNGTFVNTMANPIWEPLLMIWEKFGWKMPEGPHNRIGYKDIELLVKSANMKIVKHGYKLLIPIKIPVITNFINKYLERYLKKYAFIEYFVAKKS
jgi:ubiquinone/menaquinone biosynthesis C-methylase UbiE